MDKKYLLVGVCILAIVVLAAFFLMPSQPKGAPSSQTPAQPSAQPPSGQVENAAVEISGFAFKPASVTVKAGATVTWTNKDSTQHTIKSDAFNSDTLSTDQSFSFKFDTPGTYGYSCSIHPSMTGTVIVE
jgi:plastocyanin